MIVSYKKYIILAYPDTMKLPNISYILKNIFLLLYSIVVLE